MIDDNGKIKINIITPCSRPHNLKEVYDSINFDFTSWWIVFDSSHKERIAEYKNIERNFATIPKVYFLYVGGGVCGYAQRNAAVSNITEGYCYFLDDDNLMYPGMIEKVQNAYNREKKGIYVFKQYQGPTKPTRAIDIRRGCIDLAQFVIHQRFFGRKFKQDHDGDIYFIRRILETAPEEFCLIHEPLCYYNRLAWEI